MARKKMTQDKARRLGIVLGDQLDGDSSLFKRLEKESDALWMAEVAEETEHVWAHKLRVAYFFTAMRHFCQELRSRDWKVFYEELPQQPSRDRGRSFKELLEKDLAKLKPEKVLIVEPGDWRVRAQIREACETAGVELEILEDTHFFCGLEEFRDYAEGRKGLVLETFYRQLRKKHDVLLEEGGKPTGGEWNYDTDNRETFGKDGPGTLPDLPKNAPDKTTQAVLDLVEARFNDHPGKLDHFDLPVTRKDALKYFDDFLAHRLENFGTYQDAMWTEARFLYHSRISVLLNVKLLNPREVVQKAIQAYEDGNAPLNSVEGFVRQVLGWREFIRGVYWLKMPEYAELNALEHEEAVPGFFWDGDTEMACCRDAMENVLNHGYAHHIQRLMVLGLFAQIYGAHPRRFHEWHMAMYLDAVDWVSLPNALGMSQYGDGGVVATKPYCASGNYIKRMGNYCTQCKYNPSKSTGDDACPFTVFYWDFLARHHKRFENNRRMTFQVKNLERKDPGELKKIRQKADELREALRPAAAPGS
ncbi:MAG: cryptochrome/photolyase family protein [Opitutales bacterium]